MQLPLVYEYEHLLVINKPAGMVVHPAPMAPAPTMPRLENIGFIRSIMTRRQAGQPLLESAVTQ
jgi:hypothetical protein